MSQKSSSERLKLLFAAMLIGAVCMTVFELAEHTFLSEEFSWKSYLLAISYSICIAAIVSYLIIRKKEYYTRALDKEIAIRTRSENTFRKIIEEVSLLSGEQFFNAISVQLAECLEADYLIIGELIEENKETVRTVGFCADGKPSGQVTYKLAGTPCENVIGQKFCSYPSKVADLFPAGTMLRDMGIESYAGIPLFNSKKEAIGITAALYKKPLEDPGFTEYILKVFSGHIAAEIEFKRTEEKLRRNEEFLQSIYDNTPSVICALDVIDDNNFYYTTMNRAMENISGIKAGNWKSKYPEDILGPETTAAIKEKYRECLASGTEISFEENLKVGTDKKWLRTIFAPLHNNEGKIYRILATSFDITEQKKHEQALKASEKKFRDMLETVRLAAVILDQKGNITFCNDYLLNLTGWSSDEVLHKSWFDIFIPENDRETIKSMFESGMLKSDIPASYENLIITRVGKKHLIVWNNTILNDTEGSVIGTASIGIDVTEHRKLEEQLRQSQKMEAIGHLAGGVAHDFNNILTAIINYGTILNSKIPGDDPLSKYTGQLLASAKRGASLTQSLLAFSRRQVIDPQPLNINDVVLNMQKILDRIIGEDIEIKVITSGADLIIKADKNQIEQILMNLSTNARDAMPGGGKLTVTTEKVRIDEALARSLRYGKTGEYALLSVTDNGVGMDNNTIEQIFDPFFTTKEAGKGTGLGLAMVYGSVKQQNGFINVNSNPGKGTTFNIYIPIIESRVFTTEEKTESIDTFSGNETILLVEDDNIVRNATKILLTESGYNVLEAVDGDDAIKLFSRHGGKISLIISDIIMPRKNGTEMYEEISRIKPEIKVIFMSGYTDDIIAGNGILNKNIHFMQKPISPQAFLKKTWELIGT